MARVRRNTDLGSREARRRLKARAEPYWLVIERGLSLGYRKSNEGGAWVVRRYHVARRRHLEDRVGTADDYRDADGADVLDFGQAQRKVLADAKQGALLASGQLYTVTQAVADYVEYLRTHRKTSKDTASKLKTYVSAELGRRRVAELAGADFDTWLAWALKRRRKTKKPKADDEAAAPKDESSPVELADRQRRRKATLNRVINALKGCLNHAHARGKVQSRDAWSRLQKFRSADSTRLRWLTVEEATRLQNACATDFRPLVRAALLTGCRAGELLAVRAGDFDARSKTLLIADSKSGKPRRVPLTDDGIALFEDLTAGKPTDDLLFTRGDGSAWYRMAFVRAMRGACAGSKISPPATFHTLRHTYASHLVQAGVPLLFVASALGHSDTRMVEKHYGHLAPSQVADMIRKNLPSFGGEPRPNVRRFRRSR
jgi:integrase